MTWTGHSASTRGTAGEHDTPGGDLGVHGEMRWDDQAQQAHLRMLADRVVALAGRPTRVLDVGCGRGGWVQALREREVEAFGIDASEQAIESSDPEVRPHLSVQEPTKPFGERYDLIICSELLERLVPADAQLVIDNVCAAADRILFSSSPADFAEPTHVNTKPTATWAAWFAERGFFRRTDVDVTFHSPWSFYLEKSALLPRDVVLRYEQLYATVNAELLEKRESLLVALRQIADLQDVDEVAARDASLLARHAELVAVDNVIGLEATVSRLEHDLRAARERIKRQRGRLEDANAELAAIRSSRTWRVGRLLTRPLSRLKG